MKVSGAIRAGVAVVAGAGLVWGATEATGVADTARRSDVVTVAADTTSSRVGDLSLTCPGADTQASVQVASMPRQWAPGAGATSGAVTVGAGSGSPLSVQPGQAASTSVPAGSSVSVTGKGSLATGLVAVQTQMDTRSTERGLNVAGCAEPTRDGWLFGGGDAAGRLVRLTLVNPSASPTTVDVTVIGASGPDPSAGVKGTVVAPHERKVVTLGDFGQSLSSAALHLTASGAGVVAGLTDAWMSGETPVGEDTSTAVISASKTLVIPGVSATSAAPVVRLAVPGKEQAIVRVRAVNTAGAVVADTVRTVGAGSSDALSLTGVPAGDYAVTVTADVPVAAAAMSRTAASGTTDLTWSAPVPDSTTPMGTAVPTGIPGESASLMLTAADRTRADVVVVTASGSSTKTVQLTGNQPVVLPVTGATAVWVRPAADVPLHGALTVHGRQGADPMVATVPLTSIALSQATTELVPARG